ncbi:tetratricopeptide repeat protein [Streptomyces sp. NPDC002265]|uniref:phosphorylase family protein n=1 Tax=Streptomyces sp. NPDC002265 TaxID=3154415 RepID=UPI00332330F1
MITRQYLDFMSRIQPTAVILTALAVEYDAVRAHLMDTQERVHDNGTRVEHGRLGNTPWSVAIAELGTGAVNAAALTTQIVGWLRPQVLLFVGVAGSLKDDIAIGDVIVGTKVYSIHGGKHSPQGFHARPEVWHGAHRLVQTARSVLRDMRDDVRGHCKPIACSDAVLADDESSAFAEFIQRTYNDACAIEMEGSGAAHAAHAAHLNGLEALVIRGISNRAAPDRHEADASGARQQAAGQAAAVAVAILNKQQPYLASPVGTFSSDVIGHLHTGENEPGAICTLPDQPLAFTGRTTEIGGLRGVLRPGPATAEPGPGAVCAIAGLGGAGKTALALHVAHDALTKGWFPGGALFIDLLGYHDEPLTPDQAVVSLLADLGIHGPQLPPTPDARYRRFRDVLSRRERMLLLLDNAADPTQVAPLLPGKGKHQVLITSRRVFDSFPVQQFRIEELSPEESRRLLAQSLQPDDDRMSEEEQATDRLARLCGHLPLALVIAGAILRRRRSSTISAIAEEISAMGHRIRAQDGDQYGRQHALEPVLDTLYAHLAPEMTRAMRMLALHPGPTLGPFSAALLIAVPVMDVLPVLDGLTAECLLTAHPNPRHWKMHDLVRSHARASAQQDAAAPEAPAEARHRLVIGYFTLGASAMTYLGGEPISEHKDFFHGSRDLALTWLASEHNGLVAAALWAADRQARTETRQTAILLAHILRRHLIHSRAFDDLLRVSQAAWDGARDLDDSGGQAMSLDAQGQALHGLRRFEDAVQKYRQAMAAWELTEQEHPGGILNNLGLSLRQCGRREEALDAYLAALTAHRSHGDQREEASALINIGAIMSEQDHPESAIPLLAKAADLFAAVGDPYGEAGARNSLGVVLTQVGQMRSAYASLEHAYKLSRSLNDTCGVGLATNHVGVLLELQGDFGSALEWFKQARDLLRAGHEWYKAGDVGCNAARLLRAQGLDATAREFWADAAADYELASASDEAEDARRQGQL